MSILSVVQLTTRFCVLAPLCGIAAVYLSPSPSALAQDAKPAGQAQAPAAQYVPAIKLLPDSVAGLLRIPNLPRFCNAWEKTHAGRLLDDDLMQPFIEAQRDRAKNHLESIGNTVGLRPEDLYKIASGEVVFSWLPFEKDKRRPFAVCVVADVRNRKAQADQALEKIDKDLKDGGWVREDREHQGQTVRIYNTEPKPGQLKIEQIAITLSDVRIIAADRDSVVTDLLDAIAGEPKGDAIETREEFETVLRRAGEALRGPVQAGGGTIAAEWYAQPFQMGRILRETFEVDRGNQGDIIKLLENQGFDAVKAAGGVFALAGKKYDLLHRAFVLAPPTTKEPSKYEKAARMLQFANQKLAEIPRWVHAETATFNRLNLRMADAFWASETLINEAFGDEIFRDIIEGIRDDEDGPQIDIENNVLPNLDNQVILITDNTLPSDVNSERMLLAIRVLNPDAIKIAIRKAMEVEPDASKMEAIPGVEIWRVERDESDDDFDSDLFRDLEIGFEDEESDEAPPLLDNWAIALVEKGPGSDAPYLVFSTHSELLIDIAKRIQQNAGGGLQTLPKIKQIVASIKELGGEKPAFDRVVRWKLSLRAKYELFRQGRLRDSDSVLASVIRRIFEDEVAEEPESLSAAKLPPLAQIEKHLSDGGGYFETTEDGWSITAFVLK